MKILLVILFASLFFTANAINPENLLPDTLSVCLNTPIQLSVDPGLVAGNSFIWSTGETTFLISVSPLTSTIYSITVTDGIDSYKDSVWVNVLATPIINVSADATSFQQCSVNNIYKNRVYTSIKSTLNVQYGENTTYIGTQQNLLMDIYEPNAPINYLRPIIIFAHGGAFVQGTKSASNQVSFADSMARRGYIVACIDYRIGITQPQQKAEHEIAVYRAAQDMLCAIRFFRKNSLLYKVDTSQMFIGGTSAGAVTALYSAYWDKNEFPPSIDTIALGNLWSSGGNQGYSNKVNGLLIFWGGLIDTNILVSSYSPAINCFHTTNDPTIPYVSGLYQGKFTIYGSYSINRIANALGNESHLAPYVNSSHGANPGTVHWDSCVRFMHRFLYSHLSSPAPNMSIFKLTATGNATQYLWSPTMGLSNTIGSSVYATPNTSTTYTVTGVNANGCSTASTIAITVTPKYSLTINPSAPSICIGNNINLNASGAPNYLWSPSLTLNTTIGSAVIASPSQSLTYTVTGSDALGCTGKTTVAVNVNLLPTVSITSLPSQVCKESNPILLSGSPMGGIFSGNGIVGNYFFPNLISQLNQPIQITYYYSDLNGCSNSTSTFITVTSANAPVISNLPATICDNANGLTLVANPTGGVFSGAGVTDSVFNPAGIINSANIFYQYSDANGCVGKDSTDITVYTHETATIIGLADSYCKTESAVTLTATLSGGIFVGNGIFGNNFDPALANINDLQITISYNTTDNNGCNSTSLDSVIVWSLPSLSISGLQNSYCQNDGAVIITTVPIGGILSGEGVVNNSFNPTLVTTYNQPITIDYFFTDTNSCSNSINIQAEVHSLPIINLTADKNSVCPGESVTLIANGASTYTWEYSNAILITQTGNTLIISSNGNSLVTVTGTDTATGCADTSSVYILNSGATPIQPLFNGFASSVCKAQFGVLYSVNSIINATSYTWSVGSGGTIVSGQGTNTITVDFSSVAVSGNIIVYASNTCGNSLINTLAYTVLTIKPTTPLSIIGNAINCSNSNASFSVNPVANTTSYTWTFPANTSIISGQGTNSIVLSFNTNWVSGSLGVVASNCVGVSSLRSKSLVSKPSKPGTITGASFAVCPGTSGVIYSINTVSNATSYTWSSPPNTTIVSGQGTETIIINVASLFTSGTINVSASNNCGSSSLKTKTISSIPSKPGTITGIKNNLCNTADIVYSIAPVSNTSSYTWTLPNGLILISGQGTTTIHLSTTPSFISGIINVTANNSCGSSPAQILTVYSKPTNPVSISGPNLICANDNGKIYSTPPVIGATSYTWSVPKNAIIVSGQGTTSIQVNFSTYAGNITVKAANACAISSYKSLTIEMNCKMDDWNKHSDFEIFPNPTNGYFMITTPENEAGTIKITDMIGRIVYLKEVGNSNTIELKIENSSPGLYQIEWVNKNKKQTKKLVITE